MLPNRRDRGKMMLNIDKIKRKAKDKYKKLSVINKTLCLDSFMEGYVMCYKELDNKFSIDTSRFNHGQKVTHYEENTNETLKDFNSIFVVDGIILDLPDDTPVSIGAVLNEGDAVMREIIVDGKSMRHSFTKLRGEKSHQFTKRTQYEVWCPKTDELVAVFEICQDCADFMDASVPTVRKYCKSGAIFRKMYTVRMNVVDKAFIEYAPSNSHNVKKIIHYGADGAEINRFDSARDAANHFKYNINTIRGHISKDRVFVDKTYVRYA